MNHPDSDSSFGRASEQVENIHAFYTSTHTCAFAKTTKKKTKGKEKRQKKMHQPGIDAHVKKIQRSALKNRCIHDSFANTYADVYEV